MKERPILFNGEMVRAILEGRKTQTRRIIKPQPFDVTPIQPRSIQILWDGNAHSDKFARGTICKLCPYGKVGDRLWVRETYVETDSDGGPVVAYKAGGHMVHCATVSRNNRTEFVVSGEVGTIYPPERWTPSIHMPRWASRITLEITGVRVERLQEISEEDAKAEGVEYGFWHEDSRTFSTPTDEEDEANSSWRDGFGFLWDSIYQNWAKNPWVWVIEFRRVQ